MDLSLLDQLERQHRQAEAIIAKLEKAEGEREQRSLTEQLVTALTEHMEIEEREVYPPLCALDGEMGKEAEIEHQLARTGLDQLVALVGQPGFGAAVAMVKAGIEHHVEDEEKEAFPKLRAAAAGANADMTKEQLYEIAKQAGVAGRANMSKDELLAALGA